MWVRERSPFVIASALLGALILLFLILPVADSIFTSAGGLYEALMSEGVRRSITTSFYAAFITTLIALILGVPLAFILSRYEFPGKRLIDSVIDIPILIPHNAAGIALLMLLGPRSPIGSLFSGVGISFTDTLFGVVAAMLFVSSPFMIRSAEEAFKSIDPSLEKVARSLGASSFQTFAHILLPLSLRGILTGCLLTWARAISEFGAVVILAYNPKTAPVYLYDVFVSEGLKSSAPINGLLIILALAVFVGLKFLAAKPTKPVY